MFTVLSLSEIVDILEYIRSTIINEHLALFTKIASMLGAILAAWSYIKVSHDYMEGQGVTFWSFIKPVVIVLIICNFNTFVLSPVHSLTTMFTYKLSERCEGAQDSFCQSMRKSEISVYKEGVHSVITAWNDGTTEYEEEAATKNIDEELNGWQKVGRFFRGIYSAALRIPVSATSLVQGTISSSLFGLLYILMSIVYYCQVILCFIYLSIYGLLGPFTFAFSILNNYSRGISDWLARYIQTSFWIPVGQIVYLICSVIMENMGKIINPDIGSIDTSGLGAFFSGFNIGSWMGIIMVACSTLSLLAVPKICSYIIESTGTGGAAQSIGSSLQTGARMLGRMIR